MGSGCDLLVPFLLPCAGSAGWSFDFLVCGSFVDPFNEFLLLYYLFRMSRNSMVVYAVFGRPSLRLGCSGVGRG